MTSRRLKRTRALTCTDEDLENKETPSPPRATREQKAIVHPLSGPNNLPAPYPLQYRPPPTTTPPPSLLVQVKTLLQYQNQTCIFSPRKIMRCRVIQTNYSKTGTLSLESVIISLEENVNLTVVKNLYNPQFMISCDLPQGTEIPLFASKSFDDKIYFDNYHVPGTKGTCLRPMPRNGAPIFPFTNVYFNWCLMLNC